MASCAAVQIFLLNTGNRVKWQDVLPSVIIKKARNRVKWQVLLLFSNLFKKESRE